jgi:hypothetical protein
MSDLLSPFLMELAGLEPATSWVRSSRSFETKLLYLQHILGEGMERRNMSRNNL